MIWTRDTGKPYASRANGKETAATLRDAIRLAVMREEYGPRGFYVLIQRRTGSDIMACARTKKELWPLACFWVRNSVWANQIKARSQGRVARYRPDQKRRNRNTTKLGLKNRMVTR